VPVVACVLYKSLLHWKTMQAERTNTFDRIIDLFQNSSHSSDSITNLSYWLTNHCTLMTSSRYTLSTISLLACLDAPTQQSLHPLPPCRGTPSLTRAPTTGLGSVSAAQHPERL